MKPLRKRVNGTNAPEKNFIIESLNIFIPQVFVVQKANIPINKSNCVPISTPNNALIKNKNNETGNQAIRLLIQAQR